MRPILKGGAAQFLKLSQGFCNQTAVRVKLHRSWIYDSGLYELMNEN